jgi:hypothetical protein
VVVPGIFLIISGILKHPEYCDLATNRVGNCKPNLQEALDAMIQDKRSRKIVIAAH